MQAKSNDPTVVQRAIVSQVLRDDHPPRWTRTELEHEIEPEAVGDALTRLHGEGVVLVHGENVEASRCTRCLDALDLIAV